MLSYYDWVYCCCRPSVNIICGRIMIGLSLLSYDHILCLLTDDNNDNPIIIPPNIVFTDGRQQRQPNHNTNTYYVVVLWLGWRCLPSVNTICGRIMIGLSLSSVSKQNMLPHIVFTNGRQKRQPNHNTTTYCVYWWTTTTTTQS
jgi:hypothetical protein